MIKLSASTAAWQLIWQVNTRDGKQKIVVVVFVFPIKEWENDFENTGKFPIDFNATVY